MAVKLEAAGVGTARHWLAMQSGYPLTTNVLLISTPLLLLVVYCTVKVAVSSRQQCALANKKSESIRRSASLSPNNFRGFCCGEGYDCMWRPACRNKRALIPSFYLWRDKGDADRLFCRARICLKKGDLFVDERRCRP